jgi:hypothetical protein
MYPYNLRRNHVPRRTRRELAGPDGPHEQEARQEAYDELAVELHRVRPGREDEGPESVVGAPDEG